jgi:hypothetical protein
MKYFQKCTYEKIKISNFLHYHLRRAIRNNTDSSMYTLIVNQTAHKIKKNLIGIIR